MKNQTSFRMLYFVFAPFIVAGCGVLYTPSMQNVPLMQEKKEVRATVGVKDFQGAYAVTRNMAVMVNGYYDNGAASFMNENNYDWERQELSIGHLEAGAGYYKKLNDRSIMEIYGGFGRGSSRIDNFQTDSINSVPLLKSSFKASNTRFFIQPSIGFSLEYVDFAFSTRLLFQKYSNIQTAGYSALSLYNDKLLDIDEPVFVFLEPALTVRFGYKYVKFHAQAMLSYKYNVNRLSYLPFVFNVGIHVDIAERLFKINRTSTPSIIDPPSSFR